MTQSNPTFMYGLHNSLNLLLPETECLINANAATNTNSTISNANNNIGVFNDFHYLSQMTPSTSYNDTSSIQSLYSQPQLNFFDKQQQIPNNNNNQFNDYMMIQNHNQNIAPFNNNLNSDLMKVNQNRVSTALNVKNECNIERYNSGGNYFNNSLAENFNGSEAQTSKQKNFSNFHEVQNSQLALNANLNSHQSQQNLLKFNESQQYEQNLMKQQLFNAQQIPLQNQQYLLCKQQLAQEYLLSQQMTQQQQKTLQHEAVQQQPQLAQNLNEHQKTFQQRAVQQQQLTQNLIEQQKVLQQEAIQQQSLLVEQQIRAQQTHQLQMFQQQTKQQQLLKFVFPKLLLSKEQIFASLETKFLEYLKNPRMYDCIVSIFHAKVAQKSYGNEKRFFCPPPCVYLRGEGWRLRKEITQRFVFEEYCRQKNKECDYAMKETMELDLCSLIGIGEQEKAVKQDKLVLDFSKGQDFAAAKSLFISDSDKRKYFFLEVSFFYNLADVAVNQLGVFKSQRIKVISKPAKRKQSIKTNDCKYLCIRGGTKVALFNRLRSQNVSTRYLHAEHNKYDANARKWSSFTIYLVDLEDENLKSDPDLMSFSPIDGYVCYGAVVKFVDCVTGLSLPPMKIRKVERNLVVLDSAETEPVSQLHKCAFQMIENEFAYLCLNNDSIIECIAQPQGTNFHTCSDGAAWTIISTEVTEYRFYEALGPVQNSVGPVPIVSHIMMVCSGTHNAQIYIEGCYFTRELTVWLGATPLETFYISPGMLRCPLPRLPKLNRQSGRLVSGCTTEPTTIEFPLSIVRNFDGIIYGTTAIIIYSYPRNLAMGPNVDDFATPTNSQVV